MGVSLLVNNLEQHERNAEARAHEAEMRALRLEQKLCGLREQGAALSNQVTGQLDRTADDVVRAI